MFDIQWQLKFGWGRVNIYSHSLSKNLMPDISSIKLFQLNPLMWGKNMDSPQIYEFIKNVHLLFLKFIPIWFPDSQNNLKILKTYFFF